MATGRRRTGEAGGGKIRLVRMWVRMVQVLVHRPRFLVGWTVSLSSLVIVVAAAAFSSYFICVTPTLFVLFAPVFALCAVVFPLFVLQCFDSNLPLFCSLDPASYCTQFIAKG